MRTKCVMECDIEYLFPIVRARACVCAYTCIYMYVYFAKDKSLIQNLCDKEKYLINFDENDGNLIKDVRICTYIFFLLFNFVG